MKIGFQSRESDLVYKALDVDTLGQKIISRKLGWVGILTDIYKTSIFYAFENSYHTCQEKNSKNIKRKANFKNAIWTTI